MFSVVCTYPSFSQRVKVYYRVLMFNMGGVLLYQLFICSLFYNMNHSATKHSEKFVLFISLFTKHVQNHRCLDSRLHRGKGGRCLLEKAKGSLLINFGHV